MAPIKNLILILTWTIVSCSSTQNESGSEWQSPLYAEHSLVGKIWSSESEEFMTSNELLQSLSRSMYILLGEKHDNPDHHLLHFSILERLLKTQQVTAIAFEMLESDKQALLDGIQSQQFNSSQELKSYMQWDEVGWNWDFYEPLVRASYEARVSLAAANIDSETMMQVYASDLPAEIGAVLEESVVAQLERDIDTSHCGLLPESQFPAMVRVQQTRDHSMASALGRAQSGRMHILIAGNYHIRRDLGVPNYLLHSQSGLSPADVVSVAFMEVDPALADAAQYLEQFNEIKAYDYIWFTPAVSNEDYCDSLRRDRP